MLNIKKIIALSVVALAILSCLTTVKIRQAKKICEADCIQTSECFQKTNNFSIVNILSLQFR